MTSDSLDYNSAQKMASRFWTQVCDARLHLFYFYIRANLSFPMCGGEYFYGQLLIFVMLCIL